MGRKWKAIDSADCEIELGENVLSIIGNGSFILRSEPSVYYLRLRSILFAAYV